MRISMNDLLDPDPQIGFRVYKIAFQIIYQH